jgi:cation diffusion facilitator family transporter
MTAFVPSEEKAFVVYGAMAANAAIAVTKFAVALTSGSSAMVSEAIHSVVDTANQVLLLVGIRQSQQPPDRRHPFGHGKERYFWSLIAAIVIFGIGGGVSIYEGVDHLRHPSPLQDPRWAYAVLGAAALFEGASWALAFRQHLPLVRDGGLSALTTSKDPVILTVLFEDSAALCGLAIAGGGIFLSHRLDAAWPDGVASILIGCLLALVALFLARESRALLVGEAADPVIVDHIRELAQAHPDIRQAGTPLTMHLGPEEVLVNLSLRFRNGLSSEELARSVAGLEDAIRRLHPEVTRIFVEAAESGRPKDPESAVTGGGASPEG